MGITDDNFTSLRLVLLNWFVRSIVCSECDGKVLIVFMSLFFYVILMVFCSCMVA